MSGHDVIIIGAGQAGLATSYFLRRMGVDHLILERGRIAESWRTKRWDSFTLVTPNWTVQLPGAAYDGPEPDGFISGTAFIDHMERWAASFDAPVRESVTVTRLSAGGPRRFRIDTSAGAHDADVVVVATSTYQTPRVPALAPQLPDHLLQVTADAYRHPEALPAGGVLVVGSGQTGCQIAEELNEVWRHTYLCVGKAGRLPRRYRGRDCLYWQDKMGTLDRSPDMLKNAAQRFRGDPHLSGKAGGRTLSLHDFQRNGITLLGSLANVTGSTIQLAANLRANMKAADAFAEQFMVAVDAYIAHAGIAAPPPTAKELAGGPQAPDWSIEQISSLDLTTAGIATVVWATGFQFDFSWIDFPVRDDFGYPLTDRGATAVEGLYFMGLNWMVNRKSGIIYGVGDDASHVARHIADRLRRSR